MSFARNLIVLVVIVGIIIAGGILYVTRQDAEYIIVQMNLTQYEFNHVPTIDNMTAYLVPVSKISEPPQETQLFLPGVAVKIFQNGDDISNFVSVPYTGNGTYKIPVGLWKYPKKGEFVLINVRLVDPTGNDFTSVTYNTPLE
ncbi:MAG: hypothetical protein O8C61_12985 [Candidatus Methanoperedens sp.]|nr:hypothetical protein [Candidatus Methanoperedens sp.]